VPHTSRAVSTTRVSFLISSSTVMALPTEAQTTLAETQLAV
jgi:hypothetical protein